jgi:hypothetical protein
MADEPEVFRFFGIGGGHWSSVALTLFYCHHPRMRMIQ